MANPEHLAILKQGPEAWNEWRAKSKDVTPDLRRADLEAKNLREANLHEADLFEANLSGANLGGADLSGAKLSRANLSGAKLNGADLSGANLSGANLGGANLFGANLSTANLSGARLRWAKLSGANLNETDFDEAVIGHTTFGDNDLSRVSELETVVHLGPSTIGIDTIYRSKGKIPEAFLRGAGVPDNFIEYMHSLTGQALEYYSCFISYSTKDQNFADRLYADLQAKGVRCWFAPHDAHGGKKLYRQIDDAIRVYDKLLLILSHESMKSEWVKIEISKARKREAKEKRQMLFPVRLVPFKDLQKWECFEAHEICEYFIPDFSNWETNAKSYREAFDHLLRDLKAKKPLNAQGAAASS